MAKVILDTDILSEYLKGHDNSVARRAAEYLREQDRFTFTSVTVHEIVFGLALRGAYTQLKKAMDWLSQNEQITPTANEYFEAALIKAATRKQGTIVELPDSLIAAVAIRLGMPLVTGNTNDFLSIQRTRAKLVINNWRYPASLTRSAAAPSITSGADRTSRSLDPNSRRRWRRSRCLPNALRRRTSHT